MVMAGDNLGKYRQMQKALKEQAQQPPPALQKRSVSFRLAQWLHLKITGRRHHTFYNDYMDSRWYQHRVEAAADRNWKPTREQFKKGLTDKFGDVVTHWVTRPDLKIDDELLSYLFLTYGDAMRSLDSRVYRAVADIVRRPDTPFSDENLDFLLNNEFVDEEVVLSINIMLERQDLDFQSRLPKILKNGDISLIHSLLLNKSVHFDQEQLGEARKVVLKYQGQWNNQLSTFNEQMRLISEREAEILRKRNDMTSDTPRRRGTL